jgi:hypothetical protein
VNTQRHDPSSWNDAPHTIRGHNTDDQDLGRVKVDVRKGCDQIVGAPIVASRASEMISKLCVVAAPKRGIVCFGGRTSHLSSRCDGIQAAHAAFVQDQESPSADEVVAKIRTNRSGVRTEAHGAVRELRSRPRVALNASRAPKRNREAQKRSRRATREASYVPACA